MLKKIRNITLVASAFFCWGIAGSVELSRITLSDAASYIFTALAVCAVITAVDAAARFTKKLLVRYARARARKNALKLRSYPAVHRAIAKA